jgi:hypothetical protein
MLPHEDTSKRRVATKRYSTERATPLFGRIHANSREGNRENYIVVRNRLGGLRYPSDDRLARQIEAARAERYVDS